MTEDGWIRSGYHPFSRIFSMRVRNSQTHRFGAPLLDAPWVGLIEHRRWPLLQSPATGRSPGPAPVDGRVHGDRFARRVLPLPPLSQVVQSQQLQCALQHAMRSLRARSGCALSHARGDFRGTHRLGTASPPCSPAVPYSHSSSLVPCSRVPHAQLVRLHRCDRQTVAKTSTVVRTTTSQDAAWPLPS